MKLTAREVDGIVSGSITTVHRWWRKPAAKPGGRQRWGDLELAVDGVEPVDPERLRTADARRAGWKDLAQLHDELDRWRSDHATLYRITLHVAGADPRLALREADGPDVAERVAAAEARLDRMDGSSKRGPWTWRTLALIAGNEGVRAPDLAAGEGVETVVFKRDVRKLKELGLTESLDVGYRISPFGMAVLDHATGEEG